MSVTDTPLSSGVSKVYIFHDGENLPVAKDKVDVVKLRRVLLDDVSKYCPPQIAEGEPFVRWSFFVGSAQSARTPKDFYDVGMTIVNAGIKANAVDVKIKDEVAKFIEEFRGIDNEFRKRMVVLIASSDSDFAAEVRALKQGAFRVGVVCSISTRPAYAAQADFVVRWEDVLKRASALVNDGGVSSRSGDGLGGRSISDHGISNCSGQGSGGKTGDRDGGRAGGGTTDGHSSGNANGHGASSSAAQPQSAANRGTGSSADEGGGGDAVNFQKLSACVPTETLAASATIPNRCDGFRGNLDAVKAFLRVNDLVRDLEVAPCQIVIERNSPVGKPLLPAYQFQADLFPNNPLFVLPTATQDALKHLRHSPITCHFSGKPAYTAQIKATGERVLFNSVYHSDGLTALRLIRDTIVGSGGQCRYMEWCFSLTETDTGNVADIPVANRLFAFHRPWKAMLVLEAQDTRQCGSMQVGL